MQIKLCPFICYLVLIHWSFKEIDIPTILACNVKPKISPFWAEERAIHRRYAWSDIGYCKILRQRRQDTRGLGCNFKTLYVTSDLRERSSVDTQEVTFYVVKLHASGLLHKTSTTSVFFQKIVCMFCGIQLAHRRQTHRTDLLSFEKKR